MLDFPQQQGTMQAYLLGRVLWVSYDTRDDFLPRQLIVRVPICLQLHQDNLPESGVMAVMTGTMVTRGTTAANPRAGCHTMTLYSPERASSLTRHCSPSCVATTPSHSADASPSCSMKHCTTAPRIMGLAVSRPLRWSWCWDSFHDNQYHSFPE